MKKYIDVYPLYVKGDDFSLLADKVLSNMRKALEVVFSLDLLSVNTWGEKTCGLDIEKIKMLEVMSEETRTQVIMTAGMVYSSKMMPVIRAALIANKALEAHGLTKGDIDKGYALAEKISEDINSYLLAAVFGDESLEEMKWVDSVPVRPIPKEMMDAIDKLMGNLSTRVVPLMQSTARIGQAIPGSKREGANQILSLFD